MQDAQELAYGRTARPRSNSLRATDPRCGTRSVEPSLSPIRTFGSEIRTTEHFTRPRNGIVFSFSAATAGHCVQMRRWHGTCNQLRAQLRTHTTREPSKGAVR